MLNFGGTVRITATHGADAQPASMRRVKSANVLVITRYTTHYVYC
jgi:hypothetical protein